MRVKPLENSDVSVDAGITVDICRAALSGENVVAAVQLPGGFYNATYRLDRSSGDPLILRIAPPFRDQRPSERHLMRNEYASIPFLRPVADLMPTTLVADFTHDLLDRDYVIQTQLTGVPGSLVLGEWSTDQQALLWRSIGKVLRRIHSVQAAPETYGRVLGPHLGTWSECLAASFVAMAEGCEALGLDASDLRRLAEHALSDHDVLDTASPARLLHGDLIPGNVMVDPRNPTRGVTGIFDCDRTWWGDPAADWTFAMVDRIPANQQDAFWDGYGPRDDHPGHALRGAYYRARALGEARLEHARLRRSSQLQRTYELMGTAIDVIAGRQHHECAH